MRGLFLTVGCLLVIASILTAHFMPEADRNAPTLRWVTDTSAMRANQVKTFDLWLRAHAVEYSQLLGNLVGQEPPFHLIIDATSRGDMKQMIQDVSGVGGDIQDMGRGGNTRFFNSMGLLEDITDDAKRWGFGPEKTFPATYYEMCVFNGVEDRQYCFPCNITIYLFFVNLDTFARYGVPPPPAVPTGDQFQPWTFEQFETLGKRFVAAANPPGKRQTAFFADRVFPGVLRRSMGLDSLNETMTRCILDDPRQILILKKLYQWTYTDHLLPSASEAQSFVGNGPAAQLCEGHYGMILWGPWIYGELRDYV